MNIIQDIYPRVSVAIPLYRSARFMDIIIANIEAMPKQDIEILISDRHCFDDTIDRLMERYATDQ
jgi:glycosyltransferase involved in cell wall biosynthesis